MNMFDMGGESEAKEDLYQMKPMKEMPKKEKLLLEKEMLGLYVSGHPLDNYVPHIEKYSTIRSNELLYEDMDEVEKQEFERLDGKEIKVLGIISSVRTKITKSNEIMAFVTVEDLSGSINMIAFPKTFAQYRPIIAEDKIVKIEGRISIKEDVSIILTKIFEFEVKNHELYLALNDSSKKVQLIIPQDKTPEELTELRTFIKEISNQKTNIDVEMVTKDTSKVLPMFIDERIYEKLKRMVGEDNIKIMEKFEK